MIDERLLDDIYVVAKKMDNGEELTPEEQMHLMGIIDNKEAYRAFCLFTAMMDMPAVYAAETKKREKTDSFYRDREYEGEYLTR